MLNGISNLELMTRNYRFHFFTHSFLQAIIDLNAIGILTAIKLLATSILIILSFFASSQITGIVCNPKKSPVEYATLFNTNRRTISITDSVGNFRMNAGIGDIIEIRHLNYITQKIRIEGDSNYYLLREKNNELDEIVIAQKYAAELFQKSCENTYAKFNDTQMSKGFLRYLRTDWNDTIQVIDLDLDILQKKRSTFKRGHHLTIYKNQERNWKKEKKSEELNIHLNRIFPTINEIDWATISDNFNYYKMEDEGFIKLLFLSKKKLYDEPCNFEILINKSDSCLSSILMINKHPNELELLKTLNDPSSEYYVFEIISGMLSQSSHYLKFGFKDTVAFVEEYAHSYEFNELEHQPVWIQIQHLYKTYDNEFKLEGYKNRSDKIRKNSFQPNSIKNSFQSNFWEGKNYFYEPDFVISNYD